MEKIEIEFLEELLDHLYSMIAKGPLETRKVMIELVENKLREQRETKEIEKEIREIRKKEKINGSS